MREFLRQDSALGRPHGTVYTIVSRTGRLIAALSVFPGEEEVLLPCGAQFRVAGRATGGLKSLLQEAMECDLSDVDLVSLEEVVVVLYRELPWAMSEEERRRNPKVVEFCTANATVKSLLENVKVDGTTVVHLAAAVVGNESVVQLTCCRMSDAALGSEVLFGSVGSPAFNRLRLRKKNPRILRYFICMLFLVRVAALLLPPTGLQFSEEVPQVSRAYSQSVFLGNFQLTRLAAVW